MLSNKIELNIKGSKQKFYIARDEFEKLFFFIRKPYKFKPNDGTPGYWTCKSTDINDFYTPWNEINKEMFPDVKWSDEEPTEVELHIKELEHEYTKQ